MSELILGKDGSYGVIDEALLFAAARFISDVSDLQLKRMASQVVELIAAQARMSDLSAAVFRVTQHCLSLPLSHPQAAALMVAASAAVAGLAKPVGETRCSKSTDVLRLLEELARHITIFQALAYGFQSRLGFSGFSQLCQLDEDICQLQIALASASVWLLTAFLRSVGVKHFQAASLWEWTNGDPFCVALLVRNALSLRSLQSSSTSQQLQQLDDLGLLLPSDLSFLERSMLTALLGLADADVAFGPTWQEIHATQLMQHRAGLALALAQHGLMPLILDFIEILEISSIKLAAFLGNHELPIRK